MHSSRCTSKRRSVPHAMLRSILVPLDGSIHGSAALDLALEWGVRFDARLVGVAILDEPGILKPEFVPIGGFSYKTPRDKARLQDAQHQVRRFLSEFEARCACAGVVGAGIEASGDPTARILREAQRCDVVMIGRD